MKKLLIAKAGETFPAVKGIWGDFEDFIITQMGLDEKDVYVISIYEKEPLPSLREISGMIITGSHNYVTRQEDWNVKFSEDVKEVAQRGIPILGISYGHQLIAQAFGGEVGYHPKGIEIGTVDIELTIDGINDPLLGVLPKQFLGQVTHEQTVLTLPKGAKVLAYNDFEPHQAFVIEDRIWGVQFHPEFNADIMHRYIDEQIEKLVQKNLDIDLLHDYVRETDYGTQLLERFVALL